MAEAAGAPMVVDNTVATAFQRRSTWARTPRRSYSQNRAPVTLMSTFGVTTMTLS